MIDGGSDCAFSQGAERLPRVAGLSHGLGKGTEEKGPAPRFVESSEVGVIIVFDVFEELDPSVPAPSFVVLCLTSRAFLTGRLASNEEAQDTISDGRSTILKLFGT